MDPVLTTLPQPETGVGRSNVQGRWADRFFRIEKDFSFGLDDPGTRSVGGHGIITHDQAAVAPRMFFAEMVGSDSVEQRRQHHQDVETGFALDTGQLPDSA